MSTFQQLAVVIGPVLVTAVLGPVLLFLMSRAKQHAETENYEVLSDKARFEAMDLLVNHLRTEVDRLRGEASTERTTSSTVREQVVELERLSTENERTAIDVALWALSIIGALERAGMKIPERPEKIEAFLARVQQTS